MILGNLTTPALSIHETDDRDEGNEADHEVSKSSPGRSSNHSISKSVQSSGFRLPPIDMNSNSFKLTKVATPAVPVMMVNPVLHSAPTHKPTPPTSPMPDYSPTISPASSNESLFDNVIPVNSLPFIILKFFLEKEEFYLERYFKTKSTKSPKVTKKSA